jgi:hypothetical protein
MKRKELVEEIIEKLITFPDLNSLVCCAHSFEYPLTEEQVVRCLEVRKSNSRGLHILEPQEKGKGWIKLGVSRQLLLTVLNGMISYGCSREVSAIVVGINAEDVYRHVLTSDLNGDEMENYLPLIEYVSSSDVLESFLVQCVSNGNVNLAEEVSKKIGRPLNDQELETMLQYNIELPSVKDTEHLLVQLGRKLTSKESKKLIRRNIINADPNEVFEATHLIGRSLTNKELLLLRNRMA